MEDLAELATSATGFATRDHLTIVPAVPQHDYGPEVCLGPGEMDLPGFLELAGRLGGGVLYLRAVPFGPDAAGGGQPGDPPAHLIRRKGQTGQVSVAFAANGVVNLWERETAWFAECQELTGGTVTGAGIDEDDGTQRLSEEERARLAGELADVILADPQFRAASRGDRWGMASRAIPKGTNPWAGRDAQRLACDRAYQMTQERCDQLEERLDDLAAELLASDPAALAATAARQVPAVIPGLPRHRAAGTRPAVPDELTSAATAGPES